MSDPIEKPLPSSATDVPQDESVREVGYRKPPRHAQFKRGKSGNPKGRPKGARSTKTIMAEILNEKVKLREGEKVRTATKFEAMTLAQVQNSMKGDVRSFNAVGSMLARTGFFESAEEGPPAPCTEDESIIRDYLARHNLETK